jgi:PIN domain nuclease of toxin-antitoxin system
MLNLDTHVLLHALAGTLTSRERALLSSDSWSISSIVLWEIAKLRQLERIDVDLEDADLTRLLSRLHVWPLTFDVCREILRLDFRSDPADEIIAATSIVHRVPLVTRDRRIKTSKKVPFPPNPRR